MLSKYNIYPRFESNQLLTNSVLNSLFNYLDEQNRLTRTNLIGIGIVCGLKVETASNYQSIKVSGGVGVTSEGYLVSMSDKDFKYYKDYLLPENISYSPFIDPSNNKGYKLWELFEKPSNNSAPLKKSFLKDKIVMVFVECFLEKLKNCSPNSCDDKGAEIMVKHRILLMQKTKVDEVTINIGKTVNSEAGSDFHSGISLTQLLPELKIPRINIPAANMVTSNDLIQSYRNVLSRDFIENVVKKNLLKLVESFALIMGNLDENKVKNWTPVFATDSKVKLSDPFHYQYYYDHLSDLLETYNEIRSKVLKALSICNPEGRLFPRHLFLKEADYGLQQNTKHDRKYRHYFVPSPILSSDRYQKGELKNLFQRLFHQLEHFKITNSKTVVITPSKLGNFYLSEKAIPYYYPYDKNTSVWEKWDYEKTIEGKSNHNLSYHTQYHQSIPIVPTPPDHVLNPLAYDLESFNFLRIEGHGGQNVYEAVNSILDVRNQFSLPFDVVVLKTGAKSFKGILPQNTECHFLDLESLYRTIKEEISCLICAEVRYFYDLPISGGKDDTLKSKRTKIRALGDCSDDFRYLPGTLGDHFEENYKNLKKGFTLKANMTAGENPLYPIFFYVYYLIELKEKLPDDLMRFNQTGWSQFQDNYKWVIQLGKAIRMNLTKLIASGQNPFQMEDVIDHIDLFLQSCKKQALKAIIKEYKRRKEMMLQRLLFSHYTKHHPGLEHKGGVPIGGTFILVYHGNEENNIPPENIGDPPYRIYGKVLTTNNEPVIGANIMVKGSAIGTVTDFDGAFIMEVHFLPIELVASFSGMAKKEIIVTNPENSVLIILGGREQPQKNVPIHSDTVIADFYLPYLCCSDCPPISVIMPPEAPVPPLIISTSAPECIPGAGQYKITILISGGISPYTVDTEIGGNKESKQVSGHLIRISNDSGKGMKLVIRDSSGLKEEITIPTHNCPDPLKISLSGPKCLDGNREFKVTVGISGGTAPYKVDGVNLADNQTDHDIIIRSGTSKTIQVEDSRGVEQTLTIPAYHCDTPCEHPCGGEYSICKYLVWLPRPVSDHDFNVYEYEFTEEADLKIFDESGQEIFQASFIDDLNRLFAAGVNKQITPDNYTNLINEIFKIITQRVAHKLPRFSMNYLDEDGVMSITNFRCYSFEFKLNFGYKERNISRVFTYLYNEKGIEIHIDRINENMFIPAFGCQIGNLCTGEEPKDDCRITNVKDLSLDRSRSTIRPRISFSPATENTGAQFYWQCYPSKPALAQGYQEGRRPAFVVNSEIVSIRMLMIDRKGCWVYKDWFIS